MGFPWTVPSSLCSRTASALPSTQPPPLHPVPSPPPCPLLPRLTSRAAQPVRSIPGHSRLPLPSPFLVLSFQCFRTFRMDWLGLLLKLKLLLSTKSGKASDLEAGSSLLHWWAPWDALGRLHPGGLDSVLHLSPGSPCPVGSWASPAPTPGVPPVTAPVALSITPTGLGGVTVCSH